MGFNVLMAMMQFAEPAAIGSTEAIISWPRAVEIDKIFSL
jgi:hypothetical protein